MTISQSRPMIELPDLPTEGGRESVIPKRTHNPEGNCQRCLDPFHDPRLHQGKPLQASLQTVSLTSVMTSNRTERGSSATKSAQIS